MEGESKLLLEGRFRVNLAAIFTVSMFKFKIKMKDDSCLDIAKKFICRRKPYEVGISGTYHMDKLSDYRYMSQSELRNDCFR